MQRPGHAVGLDERVERVVERPDAVQRRDRLRDARRARVAPRRDRSGARARPRAARRRRRRRRHLPAGAAPRPPRSAPGAGACPARRRRLLAEDRRVQLAQQGARLDAEPLDERRRALPGRPRAHQPGVPSGRARASAGRAAARAADARGRARRARRPAPRGARAELGLDTFLDEREPQLARRAISACANGS